MGSDTSPFGPSSPTGRSQLIADSIVEQVNHRLHDGGHSLPRLQNRHQVCIGLKFKTDDA
jgi:hypothetical protein